MTEKLPILIAGLPRSGTTWVGEVLASARGTQYSFEPDNEGLSPAAWLCKSGMHRFPYLTRADEAPAYDQLWRGVLGGRRWRWWINDGLGLLLRRRAADLEALVGEKSGYVYVDRRMHRVAGQGPVRPFCVETHPLLAFLARPPGESRNPRAAGGHLVVKSVHSVLSLDWLCARFQLQVALVLRNPYSLHASYRRMKMPDRYRNLLFQQNLQRDLHEFLPVRAWLPMPDNGDHIAFQIMLMYKILEEQAAQHPEWLLISHDRLCITPQEGYEHTFQRLGLAWARQTARKIAGLDQAGTGFAPKRVASQQPSRWKSEMDAGEKETIERWTDVFELRSFFQEHVNLD